MSKTDQVFIAVVDLAASDGPALSPPEILDFLSSAPGKCVLVDNTSNQDVAASYPSFLRKGISVVTPNKKAFSSDLALWQSIFESANPSSTQGGLIYHESSVGAGLPIISTLKDLVETGDEVQKIEGVFSGTMSFLFNSFAPVEGQGGKWSDEVKKAKDAGYTEPDPRDDLNGLDVARKLVILARVVGLQIESTSAFPVQSLIPKQLENCSSGDEFLEKLPDFDDEMDKSKSEAGRKEKIVRFVGSIDVANRQVKVGLEEFEKDHAIAGLKGSDNIISFYTKRYGSNPLIVQGAGAGGEVTAMGVTADLIKRTFAPRSPTQGKYGVNLLFNKVLTFRSTSGTKYSYLNSSLEFETLQFLRATDKMATSNLSRKTGVIVGDDVLKLFSYAQEKRFAIPAINVTSSSTVVAALEAARDKKAPIILQMSQGGGAFFAGKGVANDKQQASIAGSIAGAQYIRSVATSYDIPVILHTDHCAKKLLPWLDGMMDADEAYFKQHGEPLFSSHMIDLSEEEVEFNIQTTAKYLKRAAPMKQWLEMEIGITGGEEDGVNNEDVDNNSLYTQPEDIYNIHKTLSAISPYFSIAAGFGNVHGVYKPGNVKLHPELLGKHQAYVKEKTGSKEAKPVFLVFHGGSGSAKSEYTEAISHGVVKVNLDTDLQYAYLTGIRDYILKKKDYLMSPVGNPDGEDKPNKKFFDPRVWVREGEKTMSARVQEGLVDFNTANQL
ncbi:MAG: hypothetical protein LQ343_006871 [Gyalolechia ehrenbergii]|nr:MAG: hypothetical protein LQ343_006871 [Gyalolechia ehrenbergii]